MSWAEQRARFPVLERYAYLNAGTFGPLARETYEAMQEVRTRELEVGRAGSGYYEEMGERRTRVRGLLAEELHVPIDRVALTDSTTQAVQVVVTALGLGPGDEVVTTDSEHFGLIGPLIGAGIDIRVARIRDAPAADRVEAIEAVVGSRTRLIAVSAVSWLDGAVLPWQALRQATDVPVLIDGAQAVGAIDVDAAEADYFTVSAQKWLCGPDAMGALYLRDPEALSPRLIGTAGAASYDLEAATWVPKEGAARFHPGLQPVSSLAGLEAALTNLPEGRFEHARELAARCRQLLVEAGLDVVTEADQATLVSFRVPGDAAAWSKALYERGVIVRDLPATGALRASVGWWNDESDLERLVGALTR
jgi:L-cysteine/cystine lyase